LPYVLNDVLSGVEVSGISGALVRNIREFHDATGND